MNSQALAELSKDERRILEFVVEGLRDEEIASVCGCTEERVEQVVDRLTQRFDASDRLELVIRSLSMNSWLTNSRGKSKPPGKADRGSETAEDRREEG